MLRQQCYYGKTTKSGNFDETGRRKSQALRILVMRGPFLIIAFVQHMTRWERPIGAGQAWNDLHAPFQTRGFEVAVQLREEAGSPGRSHAVAVPVVFMWSLSLQTTIFLDEYSFS